MFWIYSLFYLFICPVISAFWIDPESKHFFTNSSAHQPVFCLDFCQLSYRIFLLPPWPPTVCLYRENVVILLNNVQDHITSLLQTSLAYPLCKIKVHVYSRPFKVWALFPLRPHLATGSKHSTLLTLLWPEKAHFCLGVLALAVSLAWNTFP